MNKIIEHFLSILKSVAGWTTVSCVKSRNTQIPGGVSHHLFGKISYFIKQ